ncbi:Mannose-6-phosphate isomerase type I [Carpediemonas membranifera]|uniref:mannose-6-phosphate isomerase n=1 Tax=Carpediemonas membranifera TaxID=201153 RepID=A0A8J6ARD8_9EUKA|nr:Mannose-6-phosphate isomerase type I [Carpediemonas membranifera]|eukprot:KAG9390260.1 Mannose-6-phosphate isomerase type I [Carpediemonas membranifera]
MVTSTGVAENSLVQVVTQARRDLLQVLSFVSLSPNDGLHAMEQNKELYQSLYGLVADIKESLDDDGTVSAFPNAPSGSRNKPHFQPPHASNRPSVGQPTIALDLLLHPVHPAVQHYPWGRQAPCLVSTMAGSADGTEPWAEAWYGIHPKAPSTVATVPLSDFTAAHPSLGRPTFLLKALSIAKPLSIQAHPDQELAATLHARRPDIYPDASHKPELMIAVKPTGLLCGFKTSAEIVALMDSLPAVRAALGACFAEYRQNPEVGLKQCLAHLFDHPETHEAAIAELVAVDGVAAFVHGFFGTDVGVIVAALLEHRTLQPGEAVFIPANELHCYLSGEGIEVMVSSDNVVRCGLTGKLIDTDTLLGMITGKHTGMAMVIPPPEGPFRSYKCLAPFQVLRVTLDDEFKEAAVGPTAGPLFILCLSGNVLVATPTGQSVAIQTSQCLFAGHELGLSGLTLSGAGDVFIVAGTQ